MATRGCNATPGSISGSTTWRSILSDPGTIFAGTEAGIFTSVDDGEQWHPTNSGIQALSVRTLAVDPSGSGLWTVAGSGGLFRSTDAGESWFDTTMHGGVSALAIDPSHPQILYAGVAYLKGEIYRSTDRGKRWTFLGFRPFYVSALAVDPAHSDTIYAGGSGGVYRSLDAGRTWQHLFGQRVGVTTIAIDAAGRIFVGTKQHGIIVSDDGGATWTRVYVPGFVGGFVFGSDGTAYLAANGVFRSTDGGLTWTHVGLGRKAVSAVAIDPADERVLFAGTWAGVYTSTNGGGTWKPVSAGSTLRYITALAIDPDGSVLHAGTYFDGVHELPL